MPTFSMPIISVALGLSFAFGSVALVAATLNEALAGLLKLRGRLLLDGMKELLNRNAGLLTSLYTHALVNPREQAAEAAAPQATGDQAEWVRHDGVSGAARAAAGAGRPFVHLPSYIEAQSFAVAMIDAIGATQRDIASVGKSIDEIADPQIRKLLQTFHQRAEGQIDRFEQALAGWFDSGMNRVSGAYKRRAQLFTFLFGLAIAAALNVDANHIATTLWKQAAAPGAAAIVLPSDTPADAAAAIEAMQQLPVGWDQKGLDLSSGWLWRVAGWITTALAALLGAPFWFDTLQRFVQLRSTGPKPTSSAQAADGPAAR